MKMTLDQLAMEVPEAVENGKRVCLDKLNWFGLSDHERKTVIDYMLQNGEMSDEETYETDLLLDLAVMSTMRNRVEGYQARALLRQRGPESVSGYADDPSKAMVFVKLFGSQSIHLLDEELQGEVSGRHLEDELGL